MGELAQRQLPFTTAGHWRHFRATPAGLVVVSEPTFEEWAAAVADLRRVNCCLMWVVGDILAYGQGRWGEDYAQVLEAADYADGTLRVAEWVAGKFPPATRVTSLTFRHHQEVAALPPAQATALLAHAEAEGLSTRELKRLAAEAGDGGEGRGFDRAAEVDAVEAWLKRRREGWPDGERDGFAAALRGIAGRMEKDA